MRSIAAMVLAGLCLLAGCADDAPADPSLLIVVVDAGVEPALPGAVRFERHYADRPLAVGLPSVLSRFELAGSHTFALLDDEPPPVIQQLTLALDEVAERLEPDERAEWLARQLATGERRAGYVRWRGPFDPAALPLDDLLVVLTSERRGDGWGEAAVRVPLLVRYPGDAAPPGLAATAGTPSGHVALLASLLPWFGLGDEPEGLLAGAFPEHVFLEGGERGWAIVSAELKLIVTEERSRLYDLAADPEEQRNLIDSHPAELAWLHEQAAAYLGVDDETLDPAEREKMEELRSLGYIR